MRFLLAVEHDLKGGRESSAGCGDHKVFVWTVPTLASASALLCRRDMSSWSQ